MAKTKTKPKKVQINLLADHRHTGKVLPNTHTSYPLVGFIMLCLFVLLSGFTLSVRAAYLTVSAKVPGAPPSQPSTIIMPRTGEVFTGTPVNLEGDCQPGYLVKIYRNGVFAGATICGENGKYGLKVDLFNGKNVIVARTFNGANVAGPDSEITIIYYEPEKPVSSQLILKSENEYKGFIPGQTITWPIEIIGGDSPYAVSVDWGDGTIQLLSRTEGGLLHLTHNYETQGNYKGSYPLIVKASDKNGQTAYLQLLVIVNDPALVGVSSESSSAQFAMLKQIWRQLTVFIWPVFIITLLMFISFWLGEKREESILLSRFKLVPKS